MQRVSISCRFPILITSLIGPFLLRDFVVNSVYGRDLTMLMFYLCMVPPQIMDITPHLVSNPSR